MTDAFHLTLPDGQITPIQGPTRIGREQDCHIRLDDPQVSRHHATIWVQANRLHIQDQGSANGTAVNGTRIADPYRLQHGDQIQLGSTVLIVGQKAAIPASPRADTSKTPAVPPTPVLNPKPRRPWLWIGGLLALGLIVIIGAFIAFRTFFGSAGSLTEETQVISLALNLDDGPQLLTTYIGRPARAGEDFRLPAGDYFIEALIEDDSIYTLGVVTITAGPDGRGAVDLSNLPDKQTNPAYATQLRTLANFLVANEMFRLQYLELMSEGFTRPLFTRETELTPEEFHAFASSLANLGEMETPVLEAAAQLENAAQTAGAQLGVIPAQNKALRTQAWFVKSIFDYFSKVNKGPNDRATANLAYAAAHMTPEQKAEAFDQITPANLGEAQNFDHLIQMLQNGELPYKATRIQRDLNSYNQHYPGLLGEKISAESGDKAGNRPLLFTSYTEGSTALEAGVKLNISLIKEVLTAGLPGIEQGFDYADQADAWIKYAQTAYNDPIKAAGSAALDQVKENLVDQIKSDLLTSFANIDESQAEALAGQISDQMVSQLQQAGAQVAGGGSASNTTTGSTTSGGGSDPADTGWIAGFVEEFLSGLVEEGVSADVSVNFANELETCLTEVIANGHPRELAEELCLDHILARADPEPFVGSFHGPSCGEEYEFPYKWGVSLLPAGLGQVAGTVRIHDCPGGGQAVYRVSGSVTDDPEQITLSGTLQDAVGKLEETASPSRTFTLDVSGVPQLGW